MYVEAAIDAAVEHTVEFAMLPFNFFNTDIHFPPIFWFMIINVSDLLYSSNFEITINVFAVSSMVFVFNT